MVLRIASKTLNAFELLDDGGWIEVRAGSETALREVETPLGQLPQTLTVQVLSLMLEQHVHGLPLEKSRGNRLRGDLFSHEEEDALPRDPLVPYSHGKYS